MPRHKRASSQPTPYDDDDDCSRQGEKPGQRNAANARERARMRILSKAFSRLKTTLPWVPPDTKLSKLDTLRLATSYIAHLRTILTDDGSPTPIVHPLNLTWPFTIQQQTSDHSSRSPDEWSSEEQNQSSNRSVNLGLVPGCVSDSIPGPDPSDSPRHYTRSHHYPDHRHHYSDSLLNIAARKYKFRVVMSKRRVHGVVVRHSGDPYSGANNPASNCSPSNIYFKSNNTTYVLLQ